ncbi:MAG: isoprenylcysteine carboxylmethyltransferase family protein [Cytophagales bacterium]|nr:isoprenylcysteine carboxylmethyltransferase family protein [Cytophagales bacterium]
MNYFWLILSWIFYFTIHSVFALNIIKKNFYKLGLTPIRYRLMYNIFAIVLLFPIIMISILLEPVYVYPASTLSKFVGLILSAMGIAIAKMAFKSYDTKAFLGLGSLESENKFRTDGLLKYVRHPLYAGTILVLIGYFLFNPKMSSLISTFMMIIYFIIGIQFEESKLVKIFGAKYILYRKKTPMLIPRFWIKKSPAD